MSNTTNTLTAVAVANKAWSGPLGERQGQAGGYARRQCAERGRRSFEAPPPERRTPCPAGRAVKLFGVTIPVTGKLLWTIGFHANTEWETCDYFSRGRRPTPSQEFQ